MDLLSTVKRALRRLAHSPATPVTAVLDPGLQLAVAREFERLRLLVRQSMPENPAGWGFKVYSQADEDGIIESICGRIGLDAGTFVEIGCGDGRENNSHYLLLKGWRGIWVDGNPQNIAAIRAALPATHRLRVVEAMVTPDNVVDLVTPLPGATSSLDLLSVDVDSVDLQIARSAVKALRPKVLIGEYNAKFPYPLVISVEEEAPAGWNGDDYQGASLAAWVETFANDYVLVSCNLAGTNAFFVRRDCANDMFGNHSPAALYQPSRFFLTTLKSGHPPSMSFLAKRLMEDRPGG
jgi:hypothetical protein